MNEPTLCRPVLDLEHPSTRSSSPPRLAFAAALLLTFGAAMLGVATAQQPIRHMDLTSIDGQLWHATAYDAARERVVLFGKGQTWEWNGSTWLQRSPVQNPLDLDHHAMAYDESRRRVVLFGGVTGSREPFGSVTNGTPSAETWEWDGDEWLQLLPATSPSPRGDHSMVYDAARQRVVLFGGDATLNDTWEWDGINWQQRSPATAPPPSSRVPMAYDTTRQVTVMADGSATWEWDGTTWQGVASNSPSGTAMVYDAALQRVALFGSTGTWTWDGAAWTAVFIAPQSGLRPGASVAHDAARGETIFCGGTIDNGGRLPLQPVETWAWSGTSWALRHVGDGTENALVHPNPTVPGNRSYAYDSARSVIVSLGSYGTGGTGSVHGNNTVYAYSTSTREWDGRRWTVRGTGPLRGFGDAMAFDSNRDVTVLFGGYDPNLNGGLNPVAFDETWEWDGISWQQRQPIVRPSARGHHSLAFDSQRGLAILFGGGIASAEETSLLADTWEWDGSNWFQRTPTTLPPARHSHALAYDPSRGVTVMFGGQALGGWLADTWEWNGTDWQQVLTGGPPAGGDHAMSWDPSRQRILLYAQDQLWSFDGTSWNQLTTTTMLPPANGASMFYDTNRQSLVVVGNGITRLVGDVALASSLPVGSGCPGTGGVPRLTSELPRLGAGEVHLAINDARPQALVLFGLSPVQHSTALWGGCTWYLGTPIALYTDQSSVHGHAEVAVTMPFVIALRGLELFGQAAVLDPQGGAIGLGLSRGLRLRIGD